MTTDPISLAIIRRLATRVALDAGDRAAIAALPYQRRTHEPVSYLLREGEPPRPACGFVLSGIAYRHKLTAGGARQIVSIEMAGDFLDVQHLFLGVADHNIQALTRLETAEIGREALKTLTLTRPAIGHALWMEALIGASIHREWITNMGRRDARTRVAHLLCEFSLRARAAGIADGAGHELPMTQEQLGDATGLTSVHVNRTLKGLETDGLITRDRRHVRAADWPRLIDEADFSPRYLHLGEHGDWRA